MVTRRRLPRGDATPSTGRGQVITLEAFLAAALVLASVVFALQVTAVTPMSASTSNERIESQQGRLAAGALDAAVQNGSLGPTIRYWNDSGASFHGAGQRGFYRNGAPATAFGDLLERVLRERSIAFNVDIQYVTREGALRQQELVHVGTPSDNVASVSRTVTLFDDDRLYDASGSRTNTTLAGASNFYAPDASPDSPVYNVVRVEVTVWRT